MSQPTNCLENIIGVTRTACECFDVVTDTSDSGLYLDETEGLNLAQINAATDCSAGSLMDLLVNSRRQAIAALTTDLSAQLGAQYKPARKIFKGIIGRTDFTQNENTGNLAGIEMLCAPIKNGVYVLKRIGTLFAQTGTIELNIYNNLDDTPLFTLNLQTEANRLKWNVLPSTITLPLFTTEKEYLRYFFLYTNNGNSPKNNRLKCGCSSQIAAIQYTPGAPVFNRQMHDERFTWYQWTNIRGVSGASLAAIESSSTFADKTYGLLLDSELKCSAADLVCNDLDYENSSTAKVMAYAVRYKAAALLCDQLLASTNINRYTLLDRETLYNKRNGYTQEYMDRISWLTQHMNIAGSGCYVCNNQMAQKSLLT